MRTLVLFLCPALLFAFSHVSAQYNCQYDNQVPTAVCDAHTVISLGADGKASLYATSLDDGSHDNCGIAYFEVARMTSGWCPYGVIDDTQFRSYTQFCCEDIGHPIWVIMRVYDYAGNYNDCMVEVTVQDKLPPSIHCPYSVTLYCDEWYNPSELYNPYSSYFGSADVYDNCGLEQVHIDVVDNTSCGLGTIKRIWTAVDWGGATSTCIQHVHIVDHHPFNGYSINWPDHYTASGCDYVDTDPHSLPSGYDKPSYYHDGCSLIGAAYDDLVFHFVEGVCKKILRKWTVIDWCQFDPYNPYYGGIWEYTQIIKLSDHDKPQFEACQDITVEGIENTCAGRLIHDPQVWDICTPKEDLDYEYKVDLYANGSIDIIRDGWSVADEVLPVGMHRILWFVDDGCGNLASCSYNVKVVDAKAPTPVCFAQLSTVVMPTSGMITIWARDFDASSFDNCTPAHKLKFSFSSDVYETGYTFTCDNIGVNTLQIWVTDEAGNQAYCSPFITIDDNDAVCPGMNIVAGEVKTFSGTAVPDATVSLLKVMPDATMIMDMENQSNASGEYQVGFGTTIYDRMVKVDRNDGPVEGISTLDMIMLQQHIFGIQPLDNPAALYAADVDDSGHTGVNDLRMLRDAFLSNAKSLDGQHLPWLFYPETCTWENGALDNCDVLVEIDHTAPPTAALNFGAVKKGDINGDVLTDMNVHAAPGLILDVEVETVTGGSMLHFVAQNDQELAGFQVALSSVLFGTQQIDIESGTVAMSTQNFFADAELNTLNISWISSSTESVDHGDRMFSVYVAHQRPVDITRFVQFSGVYQDQMYTSGLRALPIGLNWALSSTPVGVSEFGNAGQRRSQLNAAGAMHVDNVQVMPNPMQTTSRISFEANASGEANFVVYSSDLKLMHSQVIAVHAGTNAFELHASSLSSAGLYYYQISAGEQQYTGKIALID